MCGRLRGHVAVFPLCALAAGCGAGEDVDISALARRYGLADQPAWHWFLPERLHEISGLALTPDGRLFAMDDEQAVIYEIDYEHGGISKSFALGKPAVPGDFEGMAFDGSRFWLTTSDGILFAAPEGDNGANVRFERHRTGFGKRCEIEGLTWRASRLLLLCKRAKRGSDLRVYAWDPDVAAEDEPAGFPLPLAEILKRTGADSLHPSGLAVDSRSDTLLLIAARERIIAELSPDGRLLDAMVLPLAGLHPQAEGIEITESGTLIIADEGRGGRGRLAAYTAGRAGNEEEQ